LRRPPRPPPLFPYTTLFRSWRSSLPARRPAEPPPDAARLAPPSWAPVHTGSGAATVARCAHANRHRNGRGRARGRDEGGRGARRDRKSTRLNSSHVKISYAV